MDNQLFRDIQTDLDLNGPILSFTTQPVDTTINVGQTATFTAVAIVSFPGDPAPLNSGTIGYQWYGPLGVLTEGTKYVGTKTTTLQITNVTSPTDVGAYYVVVDYVPSSETGNALNEPFRSDNGNLIAPPLIEIIAQPTPVTTISSTDANFNINAQLTDNGTDIGYQWQLDGEDVSDGTVTKSTVEIIPGTTTRTVTQSVGGGGARNVLIPVGAKNVLFNVTGGAGGKGGGNFINRQGPNRIGGRGGGGMEGWFHLADNFYHSGNPNLGLGNQLYIGLSGGLRGSDGVVGSLDGADGGKTNTPSYLPALLTPNGNRSTGAPNVDQSNGGDGGAHGHAIITGAGIDNRSSGDAGGGGGGGGASFVTIQGSIAIIAGGGGGGGGAFNNGDGSNSTGTGHAGGDAGPVRTTSGSHNFTPSTMQWNPGNTPLTQNQGDNGVPGHDGQGIDTPGGGGGGAGSPGGGGGHHGHRPNGSPGGNPGQSSFATNFVRYRSGSWNPNGNGWASVSYEVNETANVPTAVTRTTTVSGSSTDQLTLNTNGPGIGYTVRCSVNSSIASNSPLLSDEVAYRAESTVSSSGIVVEGIGFNNSIANVSTTDLTNGELTLDSVGTGFGGFAPTIQLYSLYAPDKDLNIEMDLYGGGLDSATPAGDTGGNDGGEGGFGRIRFTMHRNEEYVIAGLTDIVNTPFLYRGAKLIACVGEGGKSVSQTGAKGGDGGGIGIDGANSTGTIPQAVGGYAEPSGGLGLSGSFGGAYPNPSLVYTEDSSNTGGPSGGVTISCTKGVYWRQQGISPCEFVGRQADGNIHNSQFRLSDGTVVTNTGSILRGYKAGYNIIQTAGGGNCRGGNGARGGMGGANAGGGGSGYTDGSVTVVSTTQGGSTGFAKVVIRVVT